MIHQAFTSRRRPSSGCRFGAELLESRELMAGQVFPNDPQFPDQWPLHNTGQTGGLNDADIDMPAAWSVSTGSTRTVVAVLDNGVDYTAPDLYLNIWLNPQEIPSNLSTALTDTDSDGLITFRDLNDPANATSVSDVNGNGYIDAGDVLSDTRWENGLDENGNGLVDDLVGWDFHDNDNEPQTVDGKSHGTSMAEWIGAIGNNGVAYAGVNWQVQMMAIRMQYDTAIRVDANAAAAIDYAVANGAPLSNNSWGGGAYSQEIYDAIDRARVADHLFVAAALNHSKNVDIYPEFPAGFGLDNIISVAAFNSSGQLSSASNYGLVSVDLAGPSINGNTSTATAHTTGVAALLKSVHPSWTSAQIKSQILSTVDLDPTLTNKTVTGGRLNAANALGYVAPTKFFVVDDSSANKTFEYTASGSAIENYNLNSGNAAPRGAASTAAGDKVWVVDNNRNVYVYNTSGGLLGSWTAGSLANNAQPQGIATNGTDVWIVDAKSDKVFRYAGAATRLSGSQNAASSFNLANGNGAPTDIVTNGTHLWVVNDAANDKVFKYTVAGAALGDWKITTSGASAPTGITIDPANVSDIWIVDSGTDRVYTYAAAASRTSGSQAASSSFALAAGNSNPQGIADPPVGGAEIHSPAASTAAVDQIFAGYASAPSVNGLSSTPRQPQSIPAPLASKDSPAVRQPPVVVASSSSTPLWLSAPHDRNERELEKILADLFAEIAM